jgi:hypothetical protein
MFKSILWLESPTVRSPLQHSSILPSRMLIREAELKDNIPDETFDVLRFPGVAEKHLELLYFFFPFYNSDHQ